jgi:hypothetical protein
VNTDLSRRTETFIVRLWAEYLGQAPPCWRGEIEHVGRREVMRFGSLGEMNDWIRSRALTLNDLEPDKEEI